MGIHKKRRRNCKCNSPTLCTPRMLASNATLLDCNVGDLRQSQILELSAWNNLCRCGLLLYKTQSTCLSARPIKLMCKFYILSVRKTTQAPMHCTSLDSLTLKSRSGTGCETVKNQKPEPHSMYSCKLKTVTPYSSRSLTVLRMQVLKRWKIGVYRVP